MRWAARTVALGAAVVVLVLILVLVFRPSHVHERPYVVPAGTPARYVSPSGSDNGPGTATRPWRTLAKAVHDAQPGETVVFAPGTYGARGKELKWTASGTPQNPITFEGDPNGKPPVILGYNRVEASHLRIRRMSFVGPTGPVHSASADNPGGEDVLVWLVGSDIAIENSELADSHGHAGVYVTGNDVRLVANYIHDNGFFSNPAEANLDQGIYWGGGSSGLIANNLIVHNLANGIQLYPRSNDVVVEQNTIVDNGKSGVIIGQDATGNLVTNNIIADNAADAVRSYILTGSRNVVANNVVWNNGDGNIGSNAAGLTLIGNIEADPKFVGDGRYELKTGSPAIGRATRTATMIPYDIIGVARGSQPDVGAYQSK